jgi:hypothetical protein
MGENLAKALRLCKVFHRSRRLLCKKVEEI